MKEAQPTRTDAVEILKKRFIGDDPLRKAQLDTERAWEFLERNGCQNLDVECSLHGIPKRTLTELLSMYLNEKLAASESRERTAREALEKMLSPEMDWEDSEIGVGSKFRALARKALEGER